MPRLNASRLTMSLVLAAFVAVGLTAVVVAGRDAGSKVTYVVSTTADPTKGADYAKEAIDNVRGKETFAFTQEVSGAGSGTDPASGKVAGAVDLSRGATDLPKFRSKIDLKTPAGGAVDLQQIVVGDDVHVKLPKGEFKKSDKKSNKRPGKGAGGSTAAQVDVVDPVFQLLEAIAALPDSAFATPSGVVDGNRTVRVAAAEEATIDLTISDADRLVRRIVYNKAGKGSTFVLSGFGDDVGIEVPAP